MKTVTRPVLFALAALVFAVSSAHATGTAPSGGWHSSTYQGWGGWRTFDAYGNRLHNASGDKGYAVNNLSLHQCQQRCDDNLDKHGNKDYYNQCKGIEYVKNQRYDHHHQPYYETTCEIHWDTFAWCDTTGGTKTTQGEDGCWVKEPLAYILPYPYNYK